jgi:hypothetical protein
MAAVDTVAEAEVTLAAVEAATMAVVSEAVIMAAEDTAAITEDMRAEALVAADIMGAVVAHTAEALMGDAADMDHPCAVDLPALPVVGTLIPMAVPPEARPLEAMPPSLTDNSTLSAALIAQ